MESFCSNSGLRKTGNLYKPTIKHRVICNKIMLPRYLCGFFNFFFNNRHNSC